MGIERPCKATPVTPEQVFVAFAMAWRSLTGSEPTRPTIHIFHAQSALETGHWKSIYNNNLGGSKKHGPCDWTYFTTTETFPSTIADRYLAGSKPGAEVSLLADKGDRKVLRFAGKQDMNCFASWETLDGAAAAQLELLLRRYPKAIERAKEGDAAGYVHELKKGGYFSGDEVDYTKNVVWLAKDYGKKLANVSLPSVVIL